MKAFSIPPSLILDKEQVPHDDREYYSRNAQHKTLTELNEHHQMALDVGGPRKLRETGYPWVEYGKGRAGRRLLQEDTDYIKALMDDFGSDISIYSGPRGVGKSLIACLRAIRFFVIGYEVVSNIGLNFGLRLAGGVDLVGLTRSPYYTIWVIDEIHQSLSKWSQNNNFQKAVKASFAALRKQLSGVFFMTSQERELGIDVLTEIKWFIYPYSIPVKVPGPALLQTRYKIIGPFPHLSKRETVGEQWGVVSTEQKTGMRRVKPPYAQLEEAAKAYGSFVGIPTKAQSGANISAADMRKVNTDSPLEVVRMVDFGGEDDEALEGEQMDDGLDLDSHMGRVEALKLLIPDLLYVAPEGATHMDLRLAITKINELHGYTGNLDLWDRDGAADLIKREVGGRVDRINLVELKRWFDARPD